MYQFLISVDTLCALSPTPRSDLFPQSISPQLLAPGSPLPLPLPLLLTPQYLILLAARLFTFILIFYFLNVCLFECSFLFISVIFQPQNFCL